jgi:hypothetical protein
MSSPPLGLSDSQIRILLAAASSLPVEKRMSFLDRFVGHLRLHGTNRPPGDEAVRAAIETALQGLQHEAHAAGRELR